MNTLTQAVFLNQLVAVISRVSWAFFVAHGGGPIQISPRVSRFLATLFLRHADRFVGSIKKRPRPTAAPTVERSSGDESAYIK
jgi:hypothetical protein